MLSFREESPNRHSGSGVVRIFRNKLHKMGSQNMKRVRVFGINDLVDLDF
jgi:hypothetical protein